MNGYTKKTLMRGERIIYSAKAHFFNYFTSILAIVVGLFLTGIVEPKVPDGLKEYEAVQGATENIDKRMNEIEYNVNKIGQGVKNIYNSASEAAPEEFKGYFNLLYQLRATYFGVVFLFLGGVNLLRVYIRSKTNEYCVTNQRVVFKYGFLTTDTSEVNLDRIEGVKVKQTITDKIVGRGDVLINGIGNEQVDITKVSKPALLRKAILEAVNKFSNSARR